MSTQRSLNDLSPAEMPEVLQVASELYAQDRAEVERAEQLRELIRAAAEAGLPPEYLDRAVATIRGRRAGQVRKRRHRRALAGWAVALTLAMVWMNRREPSPVIPPTPAPVTIVEPPVAAPAASGLLVNGSFEEPVVPRGAPLGLVTLGSPSMPGWRITRGTVDVKRSYWQNAPGEGSQSLDLVGSPGAATIEHTFATVPGREYVFSGWVAHNPNVGEGRAGVFLNGEIWIELHHNTPATSSNMRWDRFAHRFRAAERTTTLTLTDITNLWDRGGTALDGLAVTPAADAEGEVEKRATRGFAFSPIS